MEQNKKVVILGGGTGTSCIVRGLKYFPIDLTCIITVSDNGSSTGRLRKEFDTPAVGDIRKVLSNLSTLPAEVRDVMEYRLKTNSELNGHAIGNLVLTALINETGNLKKSIEYLSKILDVKAKVLPLSEDNLTLMGKTIDDEIIEGEEEITKAGKKYKEFFYKEEPHILPEVFSAIKEADLIILSTGSLYTSVMPHIISKDISTAIRNSKGKVMYICNVMTQPGETDGFGVSDHVKALEQYLGKNEIDVVVASNTKISKEMVEKYAYEEQKDPVRIDYENIIKHNYELIEDDLVTTQDGTIKHNSLKVSSVIFSYLMREKDFDHTEQVEDILKKYNQTLVLNYYNKASNETKEKIGEQLKHINLDSLNNLYRISQKNVSAEIDKNMLYNLPYTDKKLLSAEEKESIDALGIDVIKSNKYAVVTMAGGQGTRLGHNGPKGTFLLNVKPKPKYLFEILADSLKKNNKKYGITLNWYIMTSSDNNDQTIEFFEKHDYFGYPKNYIKFFKQGNMPLLNEEGKLVIDESGSIKFASNGNGAVFKAMKKNGILEDMKQKEIEWVFIGAVDNALLNMVDETLLGLTIKEKNVIGSKSIVKAYPEEKVGVFCRKNNKLKIIEYSEMPKDIIDLRDENGELLFGESHIMCNLFNMKALDKIAEQELPYHSAHKKINYIGEDGNIIKATKPNAYKFEQFIFDGFKYFNEITILRGRREEDFAPIKNKDGVDSPATAIAMWKSQTGGRGSCLKKANIENIKKVVYKIYLLMRII